MLMPSAAVAFIKIMINTFVFWCRFVEWSRCKQGSPLPGIQSKFDIGDSWIQHGHALTCKITAFQYICLPNLCSWGSKEDYLKGEAGLLIWEVRGSGHLQVIWERDILGYLLQTIDSKDGTHCLLRCAPICSCCPAKGFFNLFFLTWKHQ